MTFSPEQTKQIRLCLLRHLDANVNNTFGLTADLILSFIRNEGFRQLDGPTVKAELDYLTEKHLVTKVADLVSPNVAAWKITADGRDYYASLNE